jgi:hypothetical protein
MSVTYYQILTSRGVGLGTHLDTQFPDFHCLNLLALNAEALSLPIVELTWLKPYFN